MSVISTRADDISPPRAVRESIGPWLLLAPCLAVLFLVGIFPLCYSLWVSFTAYHPTNPSFDAGFVFLDNCIAIFSDAQALNALAMTTIFTVGSVTASLILGLLLAFLFNQDLPGAAVIRTLLLIPMLVTPLADLVCSKLGVQRPCRTHLEVLPDPVGHSAPRSAYYYLGGRLARIEAEDTYGDIVCECELATRKELVAAILSGQTWTLDDIRRDVRLGMGPCQGGFCTYRAAGLVHQLAAEGRPTMAAVPINIQTKTSPADTSPSAAVSSPDRLALAAQTNLALRDFLQERWKGLLPVLWGQQLRQEDCEGSSLNYY